MTLSKEAQDFLDEQEDKEREEYMYVNDWFKKNGEKYQAALEKAVKYHLQHFARLADEQIPVLEEQYTEMTKKGIPFLERKKVGDKLERAYLAKEIFSETLRDLKVVPLHEWITYFDVKEIEEKGFLEAVGHPVILNRTYEKRNKTT